MSFSIFCSQFWQCQYTKRKIFLEESTRYDELISAAELLERVSRGLLKAGLSPNNEHQYEYLFLTKYQEHKSLKSILKSDYYERLIQEIPNAERLMEIAFSMSEKYGFVLNHIVFNRDEIIKGELNKMLIYLVLYHVADETDSEKNWYALCANSLPYVPRMQTFPFESISQNLFSFDKSLDKLSFRTENLRGIDTEINLQKISNSFKQHISSYRYYWLQQELDSQHRATIKSIFNVLSIDCLGETSKAGAYCNDNTDIPHPCALQFIEIIKNNKMGRHNIFDFDNDSCLKAYLKDILNDITNRRLNNDHLLNVLGLHILLENESFLKNWRRTLNIAEKCKEFSELNRGNDYLPISVNISSDSSDKKRVVNRILGLYFWDAINVNKLPKKTAKEVAWVAMTEILKNEEMLDIIIKNKTDVFKRKVTNTTLKQTDRCIRENAILPLT
jgi:hypothetical protein